MGIHKGSGNAYGVRYCIDRGTLKGDNTAPVIDRNQDVFPTPRRDPNSRDSHKSRDENRPGIRTLPSAPAARALLACHRPVFAVSATTFPHDTHSVGSQTNSRPS